MSDEKQKERRRKKLNKNRFAKSLRDQGDHKGAFSLRAVNPRKGGPYNRKKTRVPERHVEEDD